MITMLTPLEHCHSLQYSKGSVPIPSSMYGRIRDILSYRMACPPVSVTCNGNRSPQQQICVQTASLLVRTGEHQAVHNRQTSYQTATESSQFMSMVTPEIHGTPMRLSRPPSIASHTAKCMATHLASVLTSLLQHLPTIVPRSSSH